MKKTKTKILWYHALLYGLSQIIDGIITIFTLGKMNGELSIRMGEEIGRWRFKYKEKKWR